MNFKLVGILFAVSLSTVFMHGINGRGVQHQKTVKSIHGDVYDCVDIMKQPSLRDERLDEEQKEILQGIIRRQKSEKSGADKIWVGEGCPAGTVPIPHRTGTRNISSDFTRVSPLSYYNGGSEMVGIVVHENEIKGASATISLNHPSGVSLNQYSNARIRVQCIDGDREEFVEAGWTVDPRLYGDDKTRLYILWRDYNSGGCINTFCPGFVILDNRIPLDRVFDPVSDPNTGEHHDVDITIQMREAGNWYLTVDSIQIGYWRGNLFRNLGTVVTAVAFAGEVYADAPTKDSPPMGSEMFKGDNPEETAYMQNVALLFDQNFVPPPSYQLVQRVRCYLADWVGSARGLNGFHFLFGGTGGRADAECFD